MRRNNRKIWSRLKSAGILALGAALLAGCSLKAPAAKQADKDAAPVIQTVNAAEVKKQRIGDPIEIQAEVFPSVEMEVQASMSGIAGKLFKSRGDAVNEGDIIAHIDSKELQLQLDQANNELSKAKAELARVNRSHEAALAQLKQSVQLATNSYNQVRNAYDAGTASDAELDSASKLLSSAKISLESLKQQQQSETNAVQSGIQSAGMLAAAAEKALGEMDVKAPISGILTDVSLEPGAVVQAGATIGLVQKLDSVTLTVSLPPSYLGYVNGKKELGYLPQDGAQEKPAPITYLSPNPDAKTGNYVLEMTVANPDNSLKPGNKLKIRLTKEEEQIVLAIPTKSIVKDGDEAYVFVLSGDVAKKRRIEPGRVNEPLQEVLSGLEENERIVVSGVNQLHDNEKVQLPAAKS
ncbi:efflux RND transporter periplasmic adaptor subunit [Cohnella fermenti]|uniref:Efflux RND transporter periplasmic adaptor subunit n=1 Tax=Cohnella fermenti TaxID=2565925 RepID=A0A4S4BJQ6_9BACL|nr:efflux RND transporter periplasmic adaptor subunit [Cohnella fermenti]THF74912.1 efflux RND transporter periplasmic adaptor subunit [Cohnella fermenti]